MIRVFGKSALANVRRTLLACQYSQQSAAKSSNGPTVNASNVPGLSRNCVDIPNNPVGPSASKNGEYKNPEYFCYNTTSFAEAEVEMAKFRLPAPSNKKKYTK